MTPAEIILAADACCAPAVSHRSRGPDLGGSAAAVASSAKVPKKMIPCF